MADSIHKYELYVPGIGKHTVSMVVPDDATDEEIHNSLGQYVDDFAAQATSQPGPAKPPLPIGLSKYGWASGKYKTGQEPFQDTPEAQTKAQTIQDNVDGVNRVESALGSAAVSKIAKLPPWLMSLNAATSKTPADVATTAAGAFGIPYLNGIKSLQFGNRIGNATAGAAKGIGAYEALSRGHALMSGQPQEPLNPFNSTPLSDNLPIPSDVIGLLLSGAGGAAQGAMEAKPPLTPQQKAQQSYEAYKKQFDTLDATHDDAKADFTQADHSVGKLEGKFGVGNATGDKRSFELAQKAYRAQQEALGFHVADAQTAAKDATQKVQDFQRTLAGAQDFHTGRAGDEVASQILAEQERLDALKNPDKRDALIGNHPDAIKIRAELDRLRGIDTSKYNAGAKAQVQSAIDKNEQLLEDTYEATARNEIDASKNRIRVLQDLRRRVEAGRAPGLNAPPDSPEAIAQAHEEALAQNNSLSQLQQQQTASQKALADLNERYRNLANERLTHAANHPGATVASQADIEAHQKALAARNAAKQRMVDAEAKKLRLAAEAKRGGYAEAPKKDTMDSVISMLTKAGKHAVLPMLGATGLSSGHDSNPFMSLGPALGGGLGMAADALASTDAGRKFLAFLNQKMSGNASQTIPAVVNQLSNGQQQR